MFSPQPLSLHTLSLYFNAALWLHVLTCWLCSWFVSHAAAIKSVHVSATLDSEQKGVAARDLLERQLPLLAECFSSYTPDLKFTFHGKLTSSHLLHIPPVDVSCVILGSYGYTLSCVPVTSTSTMKCLQPGDAVGCIALQCRPTVWCEAIQVSTSVNVCLFPQAGPSFIPLGLAKA